MLYFYKKVQAYQYFQEQYEIRTMDFCSFSACYF